jgi:hypothetical protein
MRSLFLGAEREHHQGRHANWRESPIAVGLDSIHYNAIS